MKVDVQQMIEEASGMAGTAAYHPPSGAVGSKLVFEKIHQVLNDAIVIEKKWDSALCLPDAVAHALRKNSRPIFSEREKPNPDSNYRKSVTVYAWWNADDEGDHDPRGALAYADPGRADREPSWYHFPNVVVAMKWAADYYLKGGGCFENTEKEAN